MVNTGISLPIMESFYTLQGEGFFQGQAAYFIRLGGCDVGCVWCDVKESWEAGNHPQVSIKELVLRANSFPSRIVVITGGEPLMYDMGELTNQLRAAGMKTHLETSAAYPLSGEWDWICVSPKKFKTARGESLDIADELKVIVYHPSDLAWATSFEDKVKPGCKLYLQPEWSKHKEVTPLIIEHIKKHPHWEISLQTHKFMDIP